MSFRALVEACALTDGNFNRHVQVLAETGAVTLAPASPDGRQMTRARITERGRSRFLAYIDELESVVRAVNASEPERTTAATPLRLATR
ncbi:MAG: hypothetical protein NVS2B3_00720 [Vulcanimicrobiaceae bacterium]